MIVTMPEFIGALGSTLYSAKSRPFPKPSTGKIAVKVINHYGDEVLKIYPQPGDD